MNCKGSSIPCGGEHMESAFARILNMSLTGSIVIAVVLLARLLLKRAPKIYSYALWMVVLFRLLCPLSITAGLSVLRPIPVTTTPGISTVSYQPVAQAISGGISANTTQEPAPVQDRKPSALQLSAGIWLIGASVMAIYSATQYLVLRRSLKEAVHLGGSVYLADRIPTPFVMGVLRPRIYLPSATPVEERRFIIAHERHHIRRGDPVWKLLGYAALCLHWFNPLVWLAFSLAGKDMEMSCDEAVIKQMGKHIRGDYAQALLRLAAHKSAAPGMPLAFGEGDTGSRVRNMARWKKPKIWVSVLCAALCLVILAACALNPKQEEKPLEDLTRIEGPAGIGAWELYFNLPEGYTEEMQEKGDKNWKDSREGCALVLTDGEKTIGGVMAFPIPENFSLDSWDWLHALDLPEWQDETLGYYAYGAVGNQVSLEFFSDVPLGQEMMVQNVHHLYFYEDWIYDLWFDQLTVAPEIMNAILDSVSLPQSQMGSVSLPYQIGELPAGFTWETTPQGSVDIRSGSAVVGGIAGYRIPDGVYDPNDDGFLWLEDVGIPDLETPNLTISGMFSWSGSNGCALTVEDDLQNPTVKRTHRFRIAGKMVYDFWLNDMLLDDQIQSALLDAIQFVEPDIPAQEPSQEDDAFLRAQSVMQGLEDSTLLIQTECRCQNTPQKNYIETFHYDNELGFLRVTTTGDGADHAQLYVNDRYFTNRGSEKSGELQWVEAELPQQWSAPWLGSFIFIRHYVTYLESSKTGETESDLFRVDALFEDTPEAAPFYFATFRYDETGRFVDVTLQINPGREDAYTLTESIVTAERQTIASALEREYARAVK